MGYRGYALLAGLLVSAFSRGEAVHAVGGSRPMELQSSTAAIIGKDDRRELFEEKNEKLKALGRATAVMVGRKNGALEKTATGWRLAASVPTHREYDKLCSDVRFGDQPAVGDCSSSLVAPDRVLTAAHCVAKGCEGFHYVFDFHVKASGQATTTFGNDQVFSCKRIVDQNKDEDWAIVQLDRPTTGRPSFRTRPKGEPPVGTPLAVLGYPRGIPLKIARGASVVAPTGIAEEKLFLEADLDVFGGNSGSPVVSPDTLELEGILVVAFGEFEEETIDPKTGKPCRRMRTFPDPRQATPTWVTRASRFRRAIP